MEGIKEAALAYGDGVFYRIHSLLQFWDKIDGMNDADHYFSELQAWPFQVAQQTDELLCKD